MSVLYQETVKKYFRGFQYRKFHDSKVCGCKMSVGVFLPEAYSAEERQIPVIYYLSGLTCTDENASQKSCIQKYADEQGVAVVFPDTSPRGHNVDGEKDSWDFGVGAGKQFRSTHTHTETERERERRGDGKREARRNRRDLLSRRTIIRFGESEGDVEGVLERHSISPLTDSNLLPGLP